MSSLITEEIFTTSPNPYHLGSQVDGINVDNINPKTPGAGVTIDHLNIKYVATPTPVVTLLPKDTVATDIDLKLNPKGTGDVIINNTTAYAVTEGTASTVGAVSATLITIPTTSNMYYWVTTVIAARNSPSVMFFEANTTGKNIGGTTTVATTQSVQDGDASLATAAVAYAVSGTNIIVTVTGVAATTISWYVSEIKVNSAPL